MFHCFLSSNSIEPKNTKTKKKQKPKTNCSYEGQSLMVNELFPPCESDSDSDDDDEYRNDRSDASRTADEGATTDDGGTSDNEIQFRIDDLTQKSRRRTIDID